MFGVDWNNPETFWLNVTNLGLGLVVVLGFVVIVVGACCDLAEKFRRVRVRGQPLSTSQNRPAERIQNNRLSYNAAGLSDKQLEFSVKAKRRCPV